ncbi:MAG: hypothetical protein ACJAUL_003814, partial [Paraglaciecola sp.]
RSPRKKNHSVLRIISSVYSVFAVVSRGDCPKITTDSTL